MISNQLLEPKQKGKPLLKANYTFIYIPVFATIFKPFAHFMSIDYHTPLRHLEKYEN